MGIVMKNEVLSTKNNEEMEEIKLDKDKNNSKNNLNQTIISKDNEYNTFNMSNSMLITENTSHFDLYKGFFFVLIACIFKSIFSLLCKVLLNNNEKITSFHILAYKTYIMLGMTLLLSIFILYIYFTKNKEIRRLSFT